MKRSYICLFLGLCAGLAAQEASSGALSPDQSELASAQNQAANIAFIDYVGPETRIQSAAQIRAIGSGLGSQMGRTGLASGRTGEDARYSVIRAVDSSVTQGFDADILILGPSIQVDKIRNLRTIIAGYLSAAWGYSTKDASTLAVYITVYNAVHRGDMDYFSAHYKAVVTKELSAENAGLSTRYNEWPGRTRILIPLSANAQSGKLGAVETGTISDQQTTDNLRTEPGKSVGERQDMTDLQQREVDERSGDLAAKNEDIDQRQAAVDQEKADIAAERAKLEEQKQAQAAAQNQDTQGTGQQAGSGQNQNNAAGGQSQNGGTGTQNAASAEKQTDAANSQNEAGTAASQNGGSEGTAGGTSASQNQNADAAGSDQAQQQADIQSKEDDLNKREEAANAEQAQIDKDKQDAAKEQQAIDQKQEDVNQSREQIATDQKSTISEEVAAKDQGAEGSVFVFQVLSADSPFARIMRFNPKSGALLSASALNTIHSRAVVEEADSYVLVAGKDAGGGAVRLVRVDKKSLTASVESQEDLFVDSALWKIGTSYYAIGKAQNGGCHLVRFDADLKLAAASDVVVIPYTMLTESADGLVVQTSDGSFAVLSKDKLEKSKELKP